MDESRWLIAVMTALMKEKLGPGDWISLSAYHADVQQVEKSASMSAMLPLFTDNVHSVAVIKH